MTAAVPRHGYTFEEYLRYELDSEEKHEFANGQILAMTGGSFKHAVLGPQIMLQLGRQLEGKRCQVFSSDLRVAVGEVATYADVTVVCGPIVAHPKDRNGVTNPTVLVEVTSPGTEWRDRGDKLEHYKTIDSLRAVVIVSHREQLVEVHGRTGDGWTMVAAREGSVAVPGIDCTLDVGALYAAAESL